jgi:hypothetical protein
MRCNIPQKPESQFGRLRMLETTVTQANVEHILFTGTILSPDAYDKTVFCARNMSSSILCSTNTFRSVSEPRF